MKFELTFFKENTLIKELLLLYLFNAVLVPLLKKRRYIVIMNFKFILTLNGILMSLDQFACDDLDFNCDNEMSTKCKCSKLKDSFIVDCSNTGVKSVPTAIPSRTTHLYLDNNQIYVLSNKLLHS